MLVGSAVAHLAAAGLVLSAAGARAGPSALVDLDSGNPLPRIPKHNLNIGLTWEPIPKLSLFAQLYVRSEQFESFGAIFNSGWARVDIGGTYRLLGQWGVLQALEVTARVQNLLNEGYAEVRGFPALGANVLFGLRARF